MKFGCVHYYDIVNINRTNVIVKLIFIIIYFIDYFFIVSKGLVSEALHAAVGKKRVVTLVALLERMTPPLLLAKCSPLLQLQITQMLAADMSLNAPQEVTHSVQHYVYSLYFLTVLNKLVY